MATRFAIEAIFKGIDKFSAPVARMTTRLDRFTRGVRKGMRGIQKATMRVARGMRRASLTIGSLAFLGGYALKGLLRPAIDFEHALAGINAKTLGAIKSEGRLNEVRAKALALGRNTVYTATQVANAMKGMAQAGLNADEMIGGIEPILHAAAAEGSDIESVSNVIISSMKAFDKQFDLETTTRVADVFAYTASKVKTNIMGLAEGLSKVAPVAHQFGLSMETMTAAVGVLQDIGIEASMSGTQLKTMLSKLVTLSPKAAKSFKDMGIDIIDKQTGDLKKLPELLDAVFKGLANVHGNAKRVGKITEAVGLRGSTALNALITKWAKEGRGGLPFLLAEIEQNADGAAKKMYELQQNTLQGDLTKLSSAWESFRIGITEGSLPIMRDTVQALTAWLNDPKNMMAMAEKWESAVLGLKGFWSANGQDIKDIASMTLSAVTMLWEVVKMIKTVGGLVDDYLIPDFLKPSNMFGTQGISAEQERDNRYFEAYGRLPASTPAEGAPLAEGMLNGVIRIETAPGTTATVEQPKGAPIKLEPSGNDVGSGYFIPGVGFARP